MNVRLKNSSLVAAMFLCSACLQVGGSTNHGVDSESQAGLFPPDNLDDDLAGVSVADLGQRAFNCASNSSFDSCIFWKNPVAQNEGPLDQFLDSRSDLSALQTFGVRLLGLDGSGYLQNPSLEILPTSGNRALASNGGWKFDYSKCSRSSCTEDPDHRVGQIMAYFWMTFQRVFMRDQTGSFFALGKHVKVDTYQSGLANAYFIPDQRKIVLGNVSPLTGRSGFEFALNAEIVAHEYAHANFHFSHSKPVYSSSSTHSNSGANCRSYVGCLGAINEGQADYNAAILFADNPVLGDGLMNNPDGMLDRNLEENRNLTARQAFADYSGRIHNMGAVYASIWWEVRRHPSSLPQEVDTLFSEHLVALQSNDTFVSVLSKIQSIDRALMDGRYSQIFANEFARRGL